MKFKLGAGKLLKIWDLNPCSRRAKNFVLYCPCRKPIKSTRPDKHYLFRIFQTPYLILLCHCHCWNDWWRKENLFHSWILYFCYKPIVYQTMHKLSESASIWCIYIRSWSFKLGCWTLRKWAFRSLNRMLLYVEYSCEHTSFWRNNLYCNENHPGLY